MGTAVNDVIEAASKNPELLAALRTATTPEERIKVLTDAGITPPTLEDINQHLDASMDDSLAGVAGGSGTAPYQPGPGTMSAASSAATAVALGCAG